MSNCGYSDCSRVGECIYDCSDEENMNKLVTKDSLAMSKEEINALDTFKHSMLASAQEHMDTLIMELNNVYEGLDVQEFLSQIDSIIDEFTWDAMCYNEDVEDDYNNQ